MDIYRIYVVNNGADAQNFWCFLAPPQELVNDQRVFANSNVRLRIRNNANGHNYFEVPVQYVIGAGASNNAVGLGVKIVSNVVEDANIGEMWEANYSTVPPNEGPTLTKLPKVSPGNTISIVSNRFDKVKNQDNDWFSNQSFGIKTTSGFMGMTWSPEPQETRILTPKLRFYISIGEYGSNVLANWDQFTNRAAVVHVPTSFAFEKCTVIYTSTGDWKVIKGEPESVA
ncbi:hypothetical protein A7K93_04790 [Candidatus Methylacidiphilum fumarolicum]|uniref:Uncharacterized protein n=2 Tax=Candidatus Methylacidiphilum fumarolicum TaxID=591154 RepID=I0JYG2_METFB|nr:hypothetical protein [Candidatus Methylacidiphilum fumarolicum]MBW6415199.1 hypothetical protein [Candidatus Methylacidiphilum fumarolicum]TFE65837.1 hypothetical protein A7K73_10975 [Candidatus Methylacidiphilum fumarolicum]TFE71210.1 hypothetical protein A7K72_11250 [Candidatus Methylacidiphilum fumarolicum]TFE74089.1 hypothetical protein A7K93_04790 [Candidatus Methylacidiphilum fumarolicum]TFE76682.1 hypothetical protein A7D33_08585 [Candidatus Methylacidiphilum fumarolicum]